MSHPTRGAWIETSDRFGIDRLAFRRTPPGVRGLKPLYSLLPAQVQQCRTPPGVRGLKHS